MTPDILTIVPCCKLKIWGAQGLPRNAPRPAELAYVSDYFKKNVAYARALGGRWIILSARYGFIEPGREIVDYDVEMSSPAATCDLVIQARQMGLDRHREVILLGGYRYRETARLVLLELGTEAKISEPFKYVTIGKQKQAIKEFVSKTKTTSKEDR